MEVVPFWGRELSRWFGASNPCARSGRLRVFPCTQMHPLCPAIWLIFILLWTQQHKDLYTRNVRHCSENGVVLFQKASMLGFL